MKRIAVLGSTGSIGKNTLKVAEHLGKDKIQVTVLAAKENIDLLEQQAHAFHPKLIAVYNKDKARELQQRLPGFQVVGGMEGLQAAASYSEVELVISAIAGTLGLEPTVAAIKAGKNVGLANKEALVSGGALVMQLVKEHGITLIPIDSEHSALFQCLKGEPTRSVDRLLITASGGPFREFSSAQLDTVSIDQALKHPNFRMGPKVTIDSSTLMNKGLEMIEAHWLFGVPLSNIEVVIHPQQIIHSMVEFVDGSILAQMCEPTMIVPIQYAMTYPDRAPGLMKRFDFLKNAALQFSLPDMQRFRCLALAYEAIKQGGSLPCYMNAANEVLVEKFLQGKISWKDIGRKLEALMTRHRVMPVRSIEEILATDRCAREEASTNLS